MRLGDSRTILIKRPVDGGSQSDYGRSRTRRNSVKFSTLDHRPSERLEQDRIETAGAKVEIGRVAGDLAVSRALGDFQYKMYPNVEHTDQPVSCIPDVTVLDRDLKLDEFLILGCDGVFDVLMNNELALVVKAIFAETENISKTTAKILHLCLEKGSEDNMTLIGKLSVIGTCRVMVI